ncbi:hypothetical protein AMELA_G00198940 [Ameiurus melas]|uniref:Uncharacterized protein n=1 Tax=Ameiurus melas TaxID=219545 RepID=A0A7J6A8W2_AMEME|nr:hypothetical protein AMELA_G00198940 [Ameiurus melas]
MHCLCEKIPEDIGISYFSELEENQSESKALIDSRFLSSIRESTLELNPSPKVFNRWTIEKRDKEKTGRKRNRRHCKTLCDSGISYFFTLRLSVRGIKPPPRLQSRFPNDWCR